MLSRRRPLLPTRPVFEPALCERLAALVEDTGACQVRCDLAALETCDLVAMDALARLGLAARRLGCEFRLWRPPDRLVEIILLAGLDQTLTVSAEHGTAS